MKQLTEKISLLGLSLMMITPFSVSPAISMMLDYYQEQGYAINDVNILFSLPSFAILAILLINPFVSKLLSAKKIVILALLLIAFGGATPVFTQLYRLVFLSRLLLGAGIGLINAKAINIISERFTGKERIQMLGLRSSSEVVGAAVMTTLAGLLISFGWQYAFLIYLFAIIILAMYLLFVPEIKIEQVEENQEIPLTSKQMISLIAMAIYAGFVILVNTSNTLRIPLAIDQLHLGSPAQASLILSLMMLMGILSGICFSSLLSWFHSYLMAVVATSLGLGMFVLYYADNLFMIGLGALLTGFIYSVGVTVIFHTVSETIPANQLTAATTLVLLGCNIGGGGAALVLQWLTSLTNSVIAPYFIYAVLSLILGLGLLIAELIRRKTVRN